MSTIAEDEVLYHTRPGVRVITLNRPKALNSLNLSMIRSITPKLRIYESSEAVDRVILNATGPKAFCAGGDVRAIAESGKKGGTLTQEFFREEYNLNHLIGTLSKPFISILDGITMGGGVGLSVHGPIRIVTENTVFAMPETGIGLFPDVGGTFFLSRLDGELGMYLALTGHRLKGSELVSAGIGTHFVPSKTIPLLYENLLSATLPTNTHSLSEFIEDYAEKPEPLSLSKYRPIIDKCFSRASVEEIISSLNDEGSEWSKGVVETLKKMSPTSLKVTYRQIKEGRLLDFRSAFVLEYRLTQRFMKGKDFYEGIRAVLIDKDQKPVWSPSELQSVSFDLVDSYFRPLKIENDGVDDLTLSNSKTFNRYPHSNIGLPSEAEILSVIAANKSNKDVLMNIFLKRIEFHKKGLEGKLDDVIQRKCDVNHDGIVSVLKSFGQRL